MGLNLTPPAYSLFDGNALFLRDMTSALKLTLNRAVSALLIASLLVNLTPSPTAAHRLPARSCLKAAFSSQALVPSHTQWGHSYVPGTSISIIRMVTPPEPPSGSPVQDPWVLPATGPWWWEIRPAHYVVSDSLTWILNLVATHRDQLRMAIARGEHAVRDLADEHKETISSAASTFTFPESLAFTGELWLYLASTLNPGIPMDRSIREFAQLLKPQNVFFPASSALLANESELEVLVAHEEHHRTWMADISPSPEKMDHYIGLIRVLHNYAALLPVPDRSFQVFASASISAARNLSEWFNAGMKIRYPHEHESEFWVRLADYLAYYRARGSKEVDHRPSRETMLVATFYESIMNLLANSPLRHLFIETESDLLNQRRENLSEVKAVVRGILDWRRERRSPPQPVWSPQNAPPKIRPFHTALRDLVPQLLVHSLATHLHLAPNEYRLVETGSSVRGTEHTAFPDLDLTLLFATNQDRMTFWRNLKGPLFSAMEEGLRFNGLQLVRAIPGRHDNPGTLWTLLISKPGKPGQALVQITLDIGITQRLAVDYMKDQLTQWQTLGGTLEAYQNEVRRLKRWLHFEVKAYTKKEGGLTGYGAEQLLLQSGGFRPGSHGRELTGLGTFDQVVKWIAKEGIDDQGRLRTHAQVLERAVVFDVESGKNLLSAMSEEAWYALVKAARQQVRGAGQSVSQRASVDLPDEILKEVVKRDVASVAEIRSPLEPTVFLDRFRVLYPGPLDVVLQAGPNRYFILFQRPIGAERLALVAQRTEGVVVGEALHRRHQFKPKGLKETHSAVSSQSPASRVLQRGFPRFDLKTLSSIQTRVEEIAWKVNGLMVNPISGELVVSRRWEKYGGQLNAPLMPLRAVQVTLYERVHVTEDDSLWTDNRYVPIAGKDIYHAKGNPLTDEELTQNGLRKVIGENGQPLMFSMIMTGGRVLALPGPWVVPSIAEGDGRRVLSTLSDIAAVAGEPVTHETLADTLLALEAEGKVQLRLAAWLEYKGIGRGNYTVKESAPKPFHKLGGSGVYVPAGDAHRLLNVVYNGGFPNPLGGLTRVHQTTPAQDALLLSAGAELTAVTLQSHKLFTAENFPELEETPWRETWYAVRLAYGTERLNALVDRGGRMQDGAPAAKEPARYYYRDLLGLGEKDSVLTDLLPLVLRTMGKNMRALWTLQKYRGWSGNVPDNYSPIGELVDTGEESLYNATTLGQQPQVIMAWGAFLEYLRPILLAQYPLGERPTEGEMLQSMINDPRFLDELLKPTKPIAVPEATPILTVPTDAETAPWVYGRYYRPTDTIAALQRIYHRLVEANHAPKSTKALPSMLLASSALSHEQVPLWLLAAVGGITFIYWYGPTRLLSLLARTMSQRSPNSKTRLLERAA